MSGKDQVQLGLSAHSVPECGFEDQKCQQASVHIRNIIVMEVLIFDIYDYTIIIGFFGCESSPISCNVC